MIDGKTMELAEAAAQRLAKKLQSRPELYQSVERQDGGPFFDRNALLFMPLAETRHTTEELFKARPILVALATDPSLRGIMNVYSVISRGVVKKTGALDGFDRPITALAAAEPTRVAPNHLGEAYPRLRGAAAGPTAFIRNTAKDLGLNPSLRD